MISLKNKHEISLLSESCQIVADTLNLIEKKTNKPLNYTIRYWEKEFKQIKPKFINKHRYYDNKQIEIFKLINFLLLLRQMTQRKLL